MIIYHQKVDYGNASILGTFGPATKALFVVPKDYHISANSVLLSLV